MGDDVIGSLVLEHCRKNNIGTEYIKVDSSKVTSINVGLIREDGERTILIRVHLDLLSGRMWRESLCPVEGILSFASIS
ncbi:MAG: hypothetical protein ACLTW9_05500 [Enterocloster sp.]